ncbi:glycoside hydrolase family 13 protein [Corallincola luteus]|uniref:glycoside hydrolase family 13 protein n=1 Tax=Corallincola luteus TaxID=1775177 RepID=UPI00196B6AB9|nr:glycoside hydrolase family 13 protein [Corallincola luteus]
MTTIKPSQSADIATPDWVKQAVFYQIYPDRFARREAPAPLGVKFKPWGTPAEQQGFQGGDLYGVIDKLDYLQQLGITAIYLCPIFSSASNHRYHTFDFMQVDPLLGGNQGLRELLDEAHRRDMKVVLDGVFNHASRGFWPFHHILECGGDSPYIDWFKIQDWPLNPYPSNADEPTNYAAWWDLPALPQFNHSNPGVRQYIYDVAKFWLEFGIDGWRLDVPYEIDDDEFWRGFRDVVKTANPDAYICGEVWEKAQRWLQGDMFDATMNYTFCWASLSYFGAHTLNGYQRNHLTLEPLDSKGFQQVINQMHGWYDWQINFAQLNLLGSHDMARPLWILSEDKAALQLCWLFMMTMPGAPCIYYGDEIGMSSADDPYCREAYPWHAPEQQDNNMAAQLTTLIQLRKQYPTLATGDFCFQQSDDNVLRYQRSSQHQTLQVAINRSNTAQPLQIDDANIVYGELNDGYLPAQSGVVLLLNKR